MDYVFAIPSIYRLDILQENVLALLKENNIPLNKIYVFTNKDCYRQYKQQLKGINVVLDNSKGIQASRNFIRNYFNEGDIVVGMDDDVNGFLKYVDSKNLVKYKDIKTLIDVILKNMQEQGTKLGGVNMVSNPFFMNNKVHFKNCLIPACFYVFINDKSIMMTNPYELTEDGEMAIRVFKKYGALVRLNYIGLDMLPNKKTSGGIQQVMTNQQRDTKQRLSDKWLADTFPEYCAVKNKGVGLRYKTPKATKQINLF